MCVLLMTEWVFTVFDRTEQTVGYWKLIFANHFGCWYLAAFLFRVLASDTRNIFSIIERPCSPGKPAVVPREGDTLEQLAYINKPNDAVILRWKAASYDGGTPIIGAMFYLFLLVQFTCKNFYGVNYFIPSFLHVFSKQVEQDVNFLS